MRVKTERSVDHFALTSMLEYAEAGQHSQILRRYLAESGSSLGWHIAADPLEACRERGLFERVRRGEGTSTRNDIAWPE
jgi:hypothetical protein